MALLAASASFDSTSVVDVDSIAPSINLLESLPARPPTPPREANHDVGVSLKSVLGKAQSSDPRQSLQTPPTANSSPSSAPTSSNLGSSRLRKKVEWSTHTEYKEPPEYRKADKLAKSSPLSAPSSASSKPVKGILKPSSSQNILHSSLSSELDGPSSHSKITEMLDSTIKQLAGPDRHSKLDAYMMLARALKASNNLPDRVALQDKMSLFMQFIQRDITSKTENGTLDLSLVNHALYLLATFLHFSAIASTLTNDFGVFIIDHSIRSFEDPSMPKDVVRHLMQVVAFQNFSPKVMTSDRVARLVHSLHKVEDHLKGKSIVMSRIHIYKRLVRQSRAHMAAHTDWLKDMFTDMLSTIKDIRAQAISLGLEAGFSLRSEKQLLRKVADIFQTTNDDESYIDFYIKRLQEMLRDKQSSPAVPQIWSVVVLVLRCPLERWQYYGPWLKLAQSAFNSPDGLTKQEANYAWNRYVYISFLESKVTPKSLGTLCTPLLSQLRRKANPKQPEESSRLRRVVVGGICNILYYAFAPGNDKCPPDTVWSVVVQPTMDLLLSLGEKSEASSHCLTEASQILVGLLDVSTPRIWKQDRIMDTPPAKAEELPPIDSKWVRKNCDKIFRVIAPIIEKRFEGIGDQGSLAARLWQSFVGSVAAASAKDIKVSEDTAKFFACAFGFLSSTWTKGTGLPEDSKSQSFLSSVNSFIGVLVNGLGMLPFTEKKLSMTVPDTFEPITTPSHRPDRAGEPVGVVRIPLHHLFCMLSTVPAGEQDNKILADSFKAIFQPFFTGKSAKSCSDLARELIQLLPKNTVSPYGPWAVAAEKMRLPLEIVSTGSGHSAAATTAVLGPDYRDFVFLLDRGLTSHPNLPADDLLNLLDAVSSHAVKHYGDAGRALAVIEPLAKTIFENKSTDSKPSHPILKVTQHLFRVAKLPRDRQALDVARRRLWGATSTTLRGSGPFDPFNYLYKVGNRIMVLLYDNYAELDAASDVVPLFEALEQFIGQCLPQDSVRILADLQSGLCCWLQDEETRLRWTDNSLMAQTLCHLWNTIGTQLGSHGLLDRTDLNAIEGLLTSAFSSKHQFIVAQVTDTWNKVFRDTEDIQCSERLRSAISSAQSRGDVFMSDAEESAGKFGAQAPSLSDRQDHLSPMATSATSTEAVVPRGSLTRKRRVQSTPDVVLAKPAKRTSTPRLRHDNSQLHFEPIASSSPSRDESQHLTERQKEVKERQRANAAMYSDMKSSPRSLQKKSLDATVLEAADNSAHQEKATPEHNASYNDLISSTPTPRRGQVLQMDEDNDPPSSPPVPRPYPLLSEIQSRSRASSSLENWEFSSPPGTPVPSHQQAAHEAELPALHLTNDTTQEKTTASKNQSVAADDKPTVVDVIPSSVPAEERSTISGNRNSSSPPSPPLTRRSRLRNKRKHESPKQRGKRSSTRHAISTAESRDEDNAEPAAQSKSAQKDAPRIAVNDTSFVVSDVDESQMMKMAAEFEQQQEQLPTTKKHEASATKDRSKPKTVNNCIMVQDNSLSSPLNKPGSLQDEIDSVVPSTPDGTDSHAPGIEARPKRKRGRPRLSDESRKRRRSSGNDVDNQSKDKEIILNEETESVTSASRSRRMSRRTSRQEAKTAAQQQQQQPPKREERLTTRSMSKKSATNDPTKTADKKDDEDGADTDEELMSQLVMETNAASQSQSQAGDNVADEAGNAPDAITDEATSVVDAPMDKTTSEHNIEITQEAEGNKAVDASTIMGTLQSGLQQLRSAALSREDMYKMETMLLDIKRELLEAEVRGRR